MHQGPHSETYKGVVYTVFPLSPENSHLFSLSLEKHVFISAQPMKNTYLPQLSPSKNRYIFPPSLQKHAFMSPEPRKNTYLVCRLLVITDTRVTRNYYVISPTHIRLSRSTPQASYNGPRTLQSQNTGVLVVIWVGSSSNTTCYLGGPFLKHLLYLGTTFIHT